MYNVLSGFQFFNVVFSSGDNDELRKQYKEWSHKEDIKRVYIILDKEDLEDYVKQGFLVEPKEVYTDLQEATVEAYEMNK